MTRNVVWIGRIASVTLCLALAGCNAAKDPPKPASSGTSGGGAPTTGGETASGEKGADPKPADGTPTAVAGGATWEGYPDVVKVPLMTEVDGIKIPRLETKGSKLQIKGTLPVDVGNEHAAAKPSKPERGDWLVIRFNSEPKTLNPITETSAVQSYIGEYVQEALARQNPETMEFEPNVAKKWIAEDSIKLASNYPGKERQVALEDGKPAAELEVTFPAKKEPAKKGDKVEDPKLVLKTADKDGAPIGNTWVGLFPAEKIVGANPNGYHYWSDSTGKVVATEVPAGKYTVRVGVEVYGTSKKGDDGSLVVTTTTTGHPLADELKSSKDGSLTLKKGEWVDVQQGTIYTYFLRDDVKWSDGEPFTTKDLLLGYASIKNDDVDGESLRTYYANLVECVALDAHTIRMKYRQQYFKAFEFTAGLSAQSPPWHLFEKFFKEQELELTLDKLTADEEKAQKKVSAYGLAYAKFFNTDPRYSLSPLGTGPYMVSKWEQDERVEVTRNPHYWNKDRAGYLDKIIFRFIPDNVTAFQLMRAGEIDFFWVMDTEQYHRDLAGPPDWFQQDWVKAKWYSPGYGYVGYNLLKPMFQDRRVRIALGMLFNKEEFLKEKLYNDAEIVSGSEYFFGPGYDHEVKPLAYDPEVARDLLSEAGWVDSNNDGVLDKDGKKFQFKYSIAPGNKLAKERASVLQKELKEVGILMDIAELEWASFIEKIRNKDFDVVSLGWAQSVEGDPYQLWHSSGAGADKRSSNHVSFNNPQTDELIEQLRLTLNEDKRMKIHFSLHRILDAEQPYNFLYLPMDHGAYKKRFRGVKWYRLRPGFDLTEWYVPKDEQVHKE